LIFEKPVQSQESFIEEASFHSTTQGFTGHQVPKFFQFDRISKDSYKNFRSQISPIKKFERNYTLAILHWRNCPGGTALDFYTQITEGLYRTKSNLANYHNIHAQLVHDSYMIHSGFSVDPISFTHFI
jgi:hypothetical protein